VDNEIKLFSSRFIKEMAYKMTDAKNVEIEKEPPTVTIRVDCKNEKLLSIYSQWVEEISPLGAIIKVLPL
tara:strand:- start:312 stop:521 length:210 start_codon:yes stop_codon:yes gene_type:complete